MPADSSPNTRQGSTKKLAVVPISANNASFDKELNKEDHEVRSDDGLDAPIDKKLAFFENLEYQQRKELKRKNQKKSQQSKFQWFSKTGKSIKNSCSSFCNILCKKDEKFMIS